MASISIVKKNINNNLKVKILNFNVTIIKSEQDITQ